MQVRKSYTSPVGTQESKYYRLKYTLKFTDDTYHWPRRWGPAQWSLYSAAPGLKCANPSQSWAAAPLTRGWGREAASDRRHWQPQYILFNTFCIQSIETYRLNKTKKADDKSKDNENIWKFSSSIWLLLPSHGQSRLGIPEMEKIKLILNHIQFPRTDQSQ